MMAIISRKLNSNLIVEHQQILIVIRVPKFLDSLTSIVSFMCTICFSFTSTCEFLLLFLCAVMTFFSLRSQKIYLFGVYWKLHFSLKYLHIYFELARTFVIFQISDPLKDALYTCKYAQTVIWMISWVTYVSSLFICIPLALLDKGFVEGEMNYV